MDRVSPEPTAGLVHLLSPSRPAPRGRRSWPPPCARAGTSSACTCRALLAWTGPAAAARPSSRSSARGRARVARARRRAADRRRARGAGRCPSCCACLLDERGLGWDEAWSEVRAPHLRAPRLPEERARAGRSGRRRSSRPSGRGCSRSSTRSTAATSRRSTARWPGDRERRRRLSLFREGEPKRLRAGPARGAGLAPRRRGDAVGRADRRGARRPRRPAQPRCCTPARLRCSPAPGSDPAGIPPWPRC